MATYGFGLTTAPRRGLTNDDSGFLEPNQDGPGTYAFRTYRRPEAVRLLLHLTLSEIERIRSESVREEELFVAKAAKAATEHYTGAQGCSGIDDVLWFVAKRRIGCIPLTRFPTIRCDGRFAEYTGRESPDRVCAS